MASKKRLIKYLELVIKKLRKKETKGLWITEEMGLYYSLDVENKYVPSGHTRIIINFAGHYAKPPEAWTSKKPVFGMQWGWLIGEMPELRHIINRDTMIKIAPELDSSKWPVIDED